MRQTKSSPKKVDLSKTDRSIYGMADYVPTTGQKILGAGAYAVATLRSDGAVVKYFRAADKGYRTFAQRIIQNGPKCAALPKVSEFTMYTASEWFYSVTMPRYERTLGDAVGFGGRGTFRGLTFTELAEFFNNGRPGRHDLGSYIRGERDLSPKAKAFFNATELNGLRFIRNTYAEAQAHGERLSVDLHLNNVMIQDGYLVFTDPFV
jgi:hypothetical protein